MSQTQPDLWRKGFGHGKFRGALLHADHGPLRGADTRPRDQLRMMFNDLVIQAASGRTPGRQAREELRRAAVQQSADDWDGTALAAMSHLADVYDDQAANAWLQVMLAGAGRYQDAVDREPSWVEGRPPAPSYAMLVTAYAMLGQETAAHRFWDELQGRFPGLREEFVSVWDRTPIGIEFERLVGSAPGGDALPVFFHLPFCGGTSMISSLKQTVPWAAIIDIGRRFGLYQIERAQALTAEEASGKRLVHLHHAFPLRVAGRQLRHFTVLRDPVSQLSSGFHKRRQVSRIVPTLDTDSAEFAEHADYTIRNGLTNMLARQIVALHPDIAAVYARSFRGPGAYGTTPAEERMFWFAATGQLGPRDLLRMARETLSEKFYLVGTMKHLAASHLAGAAGVGLPVIQHIGHRGRSGQPSAGPAPAVESRLRQANDVDQSLYEEYTERFERDHPELIKALESATERSSVAAASQTERFEQLRDGVTAVQ